VDRGLKYILVGNGRWGGRMHALLVGENRRSNFLPDARRKPDETDIKYTARISDALERSTSQIAWLCVPPGPHVPPLIHAALAANLHVVVEKPWVYSQEQTAALQRTAGQKGLSIGVHFEYCFLSEVQSWRRIYETEAGLQFGGIFTVSARDRLGIPALQNLGSHLMAIHAYAAPRSVVTGIQCGYESPDHRSIWLDSGDRRVATVDFFNTKEPIIQRFLAQFESSMGEKPFPLNLDFALRIKEELVALDEEVPPEKRP
jgi:hypothetical protein